MDQAEKIIRVFSHRIGLPEAAVTKILPCCREILAEGLREYVALRLDPADREQTKKLALRLGREEDEVCLAAALLIGAASRDLYREKGLSEMIYYRSMREIAIWERTCEREFGITGLREYSWVARFLKAEIQRLGRLEFHRIPYPGKKDWEGRGQTVHPEDPVINIHIPEDGPLLPEAVRDSVLQAYAHFRCQGLQAFVCDSWLLYPGFYDFLPDTSNIRSFMDLFDIIEVEKVRNCADLWRVFGHRASYLPSELPRETSFQRGLADYLATHDNVTGRGLGIFLCDGGKILPAEVPAWAENICGEKEKTEK